MIYVNHMCRSAGLFFYLADCRNIYILKSKRARAKKCCNSSSSLIVLASELSQAPNYLPKLIKKV